MKLYKLKVGMVFKNYRELCKFLDIKYSGGTEKIAQIKELKRYIKYKEIGHKFIIEEVYKEPLVKVDNRGGAHNVIEYLDTIEKLILDLLITNDNKGRLFLSKFSLMLSLQMINNNYSFCNQNKIKLSKYMNIDQSNVEEWYEATSSMLERNIDLALNGLKKQLLISWSKEITVCKIATTIPGAKISKYIEYVKGEEIIRYKADAGGVVKHYREATDEEKEFIINTEKTILNSLGCESKQEVIRKKSWDKFDKQMKDILFKEFCIAFYYDSYEIVYNEKDISGEKLVSLDLKLDSIEREVQLEHLNTSVLNRVNDNSNNRRENSFKQMESIIGSPKEDKIKRRIENSYIEDMKSLSNQLIRRNGIDIKNKIRNIEL